MRDLGVHILLFISVRGASPPRTPHAFARGAPPPHSAPAGAPVARLEVLNSRPPRSGRRRSRTPNCELRIANCEPRALFIRNIPVFHAQPHAMNPRQPLA